MRRKTAAGIAACCILSDLALAAQPTTPDLELETVLVIGEQPGPGLWKVTKGDHVMWVLASHSPLASRLSWQTKTVEARIAESQEVLYPPDLNIYPSIGLLKILTLIPAALKAGKNPGGAMMKDVVPAATYTRWSELRDKYGVGRDKKGKFDKDTEEWRPSAMIGMLRSTAFSRSGLFNGRVDGLVQYLAKKHKVPVHKLPELERAVKIDDPRGMLKDARKIPPAEVDCLVSGMETLEADIEHAKLESNAWARGDIPQLRELMLHGYQHPEDCVFITIAALTEQGTRDAVRAKKVLADFNWHQQQGLVQAQRDWVVAAQKALEKNRSTFAVLHVQELLRPDGHLEKLRALGYTVEEPR